MAESYANLNDEERHEFVSLVAPVDASAVSEEWLKELHKRANDIDAGRVQLVDGDDFLRRLRAV